MDFSGAFTDPLGLFIVYDSAVFQPLSVPINVVGLAYPTGMLISHRANDTTRGALNVENESVTFKVLSPNWSASTVLI
jgi:hypothetical protein